MKVWPTCSFFSFFSVSTGKKRGNISRVLLISLTLILIFTARFFIEFLKEDQVAFESGMKLNMGQILSIPFVIAGFVWLYISLKQKKRAGYQKKRLRRNPGVLSSLIADCGHLPDLRRADPAE